VPDASVRLSIGPPLDAGARPGSRASSPPLGAPAIPALARPGPEG